MITASESAALALIDEIEGLSAGLGRTDTGRWMHRTLAYGRPRLALVDEREALVALFAEGVEPHIAELTALLHSHCHTLAALARLGLEGHVALPPRPLARQLSLVRS
jgi:hypothetical protein